MGTNEASDLLPGTPDLTATGRRQLAVELKELDRVLLAIHGMLNAT